MADRSSAKSRSGPEGATPGEAPGLGEQFGRTRAALLGLIRAHIDLARAEFSEIGGQIKRAAALGGAALLLLFLAGMLVVIGLLLFLGEAIFGSIGWGLLDGSELLVGVAALLAMAIVDLSPSRAFRALIVGVGVGLVVAGVLGFDWTWLDHRYLATVPPFLVAAVACALLIGLLSLVLSSPFGRAAASAGFVAGAVVGAMLGLLASSGPGWRVATALGVAALLLFWPIVAAVFVFRNGIDTAKLKQRFVPQQTIETTKETIEWVRERMPLGRKS